MRKVLVAGATGTLGRAVGRRVERGGAAGVALRRGRCAGATGPRGRAVVRRLKKEGHWVRGLGRSVPRLRGLPLDETFEGDLTDAESLRGCCDGVDAVLSCAGASMQLGDLGDRRSFEAAHLAGNRHLPAGARGAP